MALSDFNILRRAPTRNLESLKHVAQQARAPFDQDMLLNLAFFMDRQYTEWVPDTQLLRTIPRDKRLRNTPRPVANKIMHFAMQEHSQVLQNRPVPDVLPSSDQPLDISTADVADAYLRYICDPTQADFDEELSDASFWALIAGEGFLKWTYDADKDQPTVDSVCPLDLYIDPFATKFGNARYIIHESFMDVNDVKQTYNVEVQGSKADATKTALLQEMGYTPVLEGAVVNELWIKPGSPQHPDGLFVVWSGKDILVEPAKFPYRHGQIPFTQIGSIPRLKTPHYTCAVKYLRNPQMELNKYHAQKLSTREAFANPKWWIPTELELEADPDDSVRQILRGNSNGGTMAPQILQGELMQDSDDGTWIKEEMMDVVGLHEVSQAQVPGRVEAAKAIELLKESDTSRLEEMERTIKKSITIGFWQMLMLAKQYVSEEKMVQTYSPEGYPEVRRFKSDDLNPGMRIRVTMGTGLSRSRAARQEYAMLLWQNQVVTDPEIFAQIVDIPVETVAPQRAYDIRLARNENLEIASGDEGIALTPNSWDAHDVHIREHNNYRKTNEFRNLSGATKSKFEFHVQTHEELQIKEFEKQARLAMIQQGQTAVPPDQAPEAAEAVNAQPAEEEASPNG
jgi:hypothetical protein